MLSWNCTGGTLQAGVNGPSQGERVKRMGLIIWRNAVKIDNWEDGNMGCADETFRKMQVIMIDDNWFSRRDDGASDKLLLAFLRVNTELNVSIVNIGTCGRLVQRIDRIVIGFHVTHL